MGYLVKSTPRAERDIEQLYVSIHVQHSRLAEKWYLGLKAAIRSLAEHPHRCPVLSRRSQQRHLLYGRKPHVYSVIFRVVEKTKEVQVLHIRHGARE